MRSAAGSPPGRTAAGDEASDDTSDGDERWMRRALELAGRGWGRVEPNPLVGAVVVRDGEPVGEGYHAEFGGPHAEVRALREAGEAAAGSVLYVTLEPCRSPGKTPPCTEAILEAGVGRVVVGCRDPHPGAGGGAEALEEEGVAVRTGVLAEEARSMNASFLWRQAEGPPFVALKYALSLDARLSRAPGRRTEVTGDAAVREVHRLRAGFRAVLVGRRTATVDDPRLTAREGPRPRRAAIRIVLDPELRLAPDSALATGEGGGPVWAVCGGRAPSGRRRGLERAGVRVVEVPETEPGRLDVGALLERLAEEGVESLFVEGGGRVGASFLRADRVHRMFLFYAPVLYGENGVPGFPAPDFGPAGERGAWVTARRRSLGRDTLLVLDRYAVRQRLREVA